MPGHILTFYNVFLDELQRNKGLPYVIWVSLRQEEVLDRRFFLDPFNSRQDGCKEIDRERKIERMGRKIDVT